MLLQLPQLGLAQWYKIAIPKTGVYQLTGKDLSKLGVRLKDISPSEVQFYSSPGDQLSEKGGSKIAQELVQIPVQFNGEMSSLSRNDSFWFFAQGSKNGNSLHQYDAYNYVFVKLNDGKALSIEKPEVSEESSGVISSLYTTFRKEEEKFNLVNSGREWFGDFINTEYFQKLSLEGLKPSVPITFSAQLLSTAPNQPQIVLYESGEEKTRLALKQSFHDPSSFSNQYRRVGNYQQLEVSFVPSNAEVDLRFEITNAQNSRDGAYLDWYKIDYERNLSKSENQWLGTFEGEIGEVYALQSSDLLWDVSEALHPIEIDKKVQLEEGTKICVFNEQNIFSVTNIEKVEMIDPSLQTAQYLIITPKEYEAVAQLYKEYRSQQDTLQVSIASIEDIYNQYSGGKQDPVAIRLFVRDMWSYNAEALQYVLLMGDANFDFKNNRNLDFINPKTMIPAYQSRESVEPIYSFSSDDYFGFLGDDKGFWEEGTSQFNAWISANDELHTLDVAIGRIPAKNADEAYKYLQKVIEYESQKGSWRNKVLFVADDEDFNIHLRDAERFSTQLGEINPQTRISKLYVDYFEQIGSGLSQTSPTAQLHLDRAISDGLFLINFNGHGSETGWTSEKVLTLGQVQQWSNTGKYPIFFTATCEYGRYDDPIQTSGAELSLLNRYNGAIALLTTTRPVFASTNFSINKAFYDELAKNSNQRLGDIFKNTKNAAIRGELNRNFTLLGDPALRIPRFNNDLQITEVQNLGDSLKWSLGSKVTLKGSSQSIQNGTVIIDVKGGKSKKNTLGNGSTSQTFTELETSIYTGQSQITNGSFEFSFTVPTSIQNLESNGQVSLYAYHEQLETFGAFDNFSLELESIIDSLDNQPPSIELLFQEGKELTFILSDQQGVDINSISISYSDTVIQGSQFYLHNANQNEGLLTFSINNSGDPSINLSISVTDNHNNSTTESFLLNLNETKRHTITTTQYPNPTSSFINVNVTNLKKGDDIKLKLDIFDKHGRLMKTEEYDCYICGSEVDIGMNVGNSLITQGLYYYQLTTQSLTSEASSVSGGKFLFWK